MKENKWTNQRKWYQNFKQEPAKRKQQLQERTRMKNEENIFLVMTKERKEWCTPGKERHFQTFYVTDTSNQCPIYVPNSFTFSFLTMAYYLAVNTFNLQSIFQTDKHFPDINLRFNILEPTKRILWQYIKSCHDCFVRFCCSSWPNTLYSPSPTAVNTILYGFFPPNPLNCVIILLEFRLTTFSQSEDKYYNKRELLSSLCQLENGTNSSTHSLV